MEIEKIQNEGQTTLKLKGRVDTVTSPKLQDMLAEVLSDSDEIELDFAGIDYVARVSSGKTVNVVTPHIFRSAVLPSK